MIRCAANGSFRVESKREKKKERKKSAKTEDREKNIGFVLHNYCWVGGDRISAGARLNKKTENAGISLFESVVVHVVQ